METTPQTYPVATLRPSLQFEVFADFLLTCKGRTPLTLHGHGGGRTATHAPTRRHQGRTQTIIFRPNAIHLCHSDLYVFGRDYFLHEVACSA